MHAATLRFDEAQHRYYIGSRELPSVTKILSMLDSFEHVPPDVLEAARIFGTHVHMAVDLDNKGVLDEEALDPQLLPYLQGWRRFRAESGFEILHSEQRVVHELLGYAGTLDVVGNFRGSFALLDVKSGALPRSVGYQTAAYVEAYGAMFGMKPGRRFCLQLSPEFAIGYKLHALTKRTDWNGFVSCLNVWKDLNN